MGPLEMIALAVAAYNVANQIKAMATKEVEKDETLSPEQKKEYLARIEAAQAGVTKIE